MSRVVVYHHNDLDGRCAAAIVYHYCKKKLLPDTSCVFREVNYQDEIKFDDLNKSDMVFVVDFSFKPEVMAEVRKRAYNVTWCDHHVTAKAYGYDDLDGYRDFTDKGLSGCECTWKACFQKSPFPSSVKLIGDYDSWRLQEQPLCFQFYEGMKIENTRPESIIWDALLGFCDDVNPDLRVNEICAQGRSVIKYRDHYCAEISREFGYETQIDGHYTYAMNLFRFGSKQFGELFSKYDVCIAYIYNGQEYVVSLYSETVDVSVIAKKYGGGGHKGAAGFTCKTLPF